MMLKTDINHFFAAGIFVLVNDHGEPMLVSAKHKKKGVYKIPGGTSEKQNGNNPDFYDPHSLNGVIAKMRYTCERVFGRKVFTQEKETIESIISQLTSQNVGPYALQMAIELIEETGMIPVKFKLFVKQSVSPTHDQFFFVIQEVKTFSKNKGMFVSIKEKDSVDLLPIEGYDYFCVDPDVEKIIAIPLLNATGKYNFAWNHEKPLSLFITDVQKQEEKQKGEEKLLQSYGY